MQKTLVYKKNYVGYSVIVENVEMKYFSRFIFAFLLWYFLPAACV